MSRSTWGSLLFLELGFRLQELSHYELLWILPDCGAVVVTLSASRFLEPDDPTDLASLGDLAVRELKAMNLYPDGARFSSALAACCQ